MKTIKYLAIVMLSLTLVNCSTDDKGEREYGVSSINFLNQGQAKSVFVLSDSGYTDAVLEFGSVNKVSGNNTVRLVPDVANSTAVEGVDYTILKGTDELSSGEDTGSFTVRFLESPATQAGKTVVFRLESETLPNATYNNVLVVNVSLTCPIETFLGDFSSNTWILEEMSVNEIVAGSAPNSMRIVDFWPSITSPDLVFTYDPTTYIVTVPEQGTGFNYSPTAEIKIRPAMSGLASSFNPCTRVLTLNVNYYVPGVGNYPDQVEIFTGI